MDPGDLDDILEALNLQAAMPADLPPLQLLGENGAPAASFHVRSVHHELVVHVECVEHCVEAEFEIRRDAPRSSYTVSVPLVAEADTLVRAVRAVVSSHSRPDRVIEGQVRQTREGRAVYDAAVAQGKTAFLARDSRRGTFTWSLGNMEAGERVRFTMAMLAPSCLRKADTLGGGAGGERCSVFRVAVPGTGGDSAAAIFHNGGEGGAAREPEGEEPALPSEAEAWNTQLTMTVRVDEVLAPYIAHVRCTMGDSSFAEARDWPNATLVVDRASMPLRGDAIAVYLAAFLPPSAGIHVVAAPIAPALEPGVDLPGGLRPYRYALGVSLLDQRYPAPALAEPARVVFAIDMSGSMFFSSNRAYKAIRATLTLMQLLPPRSRVAFLLWGSRTQWVARAAGGSGGALAPGAARFDASVVFETSPQLMDALRAALLKGERPAVRDLGGTSVGTAMVEALRAADSMGGGDGGGDGGGAAPPQPAAEVAAADEGDARQHISRAVNDARPPRSESIVLLLTDGEFGAPPTLSERHRLAVVGVGSECNASQLHELAKRGRGSSCVLPDALSDATMTLRLQELLTDVLAPTRVTVSLPGTGGEGALLSTAEASAPLPAHTPYQVYALCRELPEAVRIATSPPRQSWDVAVTVLDVVPRHAVAAARATAENAGSDGSGGGGASTVDTTAIAGGPGAWLVHRAAFEVAATSGALLPARAAVAQQLSVAHKRLDALFVGVENARPAQLPVPDAGIDDGGANVYMLRRHVRGASDSSDASESDGDDGGDEDHEDEEDEADGAEAMHDLAQVRQAMHGIVDLQRTVTSSLEQQDALFDSLEVKTASLKVADIPVRAPPAPSGGGVVGLVRRFLPGSSSSSSAHPAPPPPPPAAEAMSYAAAVPSPPMQPSLRPELHAELAELEAMISSEDAFVRTSAPAERAHKGAVKHKRKEAARPTVAVAAAAPASAPSRRSAPAPAPAPNAGRSGGGAGAAAGSGSAASSGGGGGAATAAATATARRLMDALRGDHWECDAALPVPEAVWRQAAALLGADANTAAAAAAAVFAEAGGAMSPDPARVAQLRADSAAWRTLCWAVTQAVLAWADAELLPACAADVRVLFKGLVRAARRYTATA